jgi:hypothetical protein
VGALREHSSGGVGRFDAVALKEAEIVSPIAAGFGAESLQLAVTVRPLIWAKDT